MTPSPSMLPVSDEQHEKAIRTAASALYSAQCWGDPEAMVREALAAYFDSLAEQGVRLVAVNRPEHDEMIEWFTKRLGTESTEVAVQYIEALYAEAATARAELVREVAEWLRERGSVQTHHEFLRRFGGSDDRA